MREGQEPGVPVKVREAFENELLSHAKREPEKTSKILTMLDELFHGGEVYYVNMATNATQGSAAGIAPMPWGQGRARPAPMPKGRACSS